MKSKPNPFLNSFLAASAIVSFSTAAIAATNSWIVGDGTWDTITANWASPTTWTNGDNAVFSNTNAATTITLSSGITAGTVTVGSASNNANYTFTANGLSATSFILQGNPFNDDTQIPTCAFNNATVDVSGGLGIGRMGLVIGGSSSVTTGKIGVDGITSADWGYLTIKDSANVTATNGIDGNTTAWGINLLGGTLTTKSIKAADFDYHGAYLYFNGTTVKANTTDTVNSFISLYNGSRAYIGSGGAIFDTDGHDIRIGTTLANASSAPTSSNGGTTLSGSGGLTKSGAGTLTLTAGNNYSGPTIVNGGKLVLDNGGNDNGYGRIYGAVTVNSGATLEFLSSGSNAGFGWQGQISSVAINGGTITSGTGVLNHIWVIGDNDTTGITMTGGTLQSNGGVSDPAGAQLEWNRTKLFTLASADTATIGGRIRMRNDNGYTGILFNVAEGDAATDLLVSAAITEASGGMGITKSGPGTMALTGVNTYTGTTTVNEGTLVISGTGNYTGTIQVNAGTLSLNNAVIDDAASVVIADGSTVNLNFTGSDMVGSLDINGSGPLPPGIYSATTPGYETYFTGGGSLVVASANGTWTSLSSGNWSTAFNWDGNTIAAGYDATATFNAATGVTVTVDSNRKIGNLAFDVSNYLIAGSNSLTLDSSATPAISVTAGRTATISAGLAGTLGMEKTGAGKLVFEGVKTYSGGTTVTEGTLELAGGTGGNSLIRGSLNISPGATVAITGGDGSGFGWNNPVTAINIDGGTINAAGGSHIGFGSVAIMTLNNGGSVQGTWQWNAVSFSSYGDSTNTISGSLVLRADYGANHPFYVDNGAAGTDLLISGNLSDQWPEYQAVSASGLTKSGNGTMVLSGTNTYDGNTVINDGALNVTASGSLHFRPTTNSSTSSVSGTATLSFLGTVDLDLGAADTTIGNTWTLFSLGGFSSATLSPISVTSNLGSFSPVSATAWELPVTGAKWVFNAGTGTLSYVASGSDYDTWKTDNGVVGGENDDDDNDGLTNHEEYAFGLDPTGGSSVTPITIPLDKTTGTFTYTRRDTTKTDLTYTVWTSTNLVDWSPATVSETVTGPVADVETVQVTLSPIPTEPKLFIQVRAN